MSIADRLRDVRGRMDAACRAANREPSEVTLVAVSKRHPPAAIREAMAAGQLDFGENYAQELRDKARLLAAPGPGPRWHFVGRLQRNKVRYVAGTAALFHALDDLSLCELFERRCERPQPVLVQVSQGPRPGGVPAERALGFCERVHAHPGVELRGLMCLPPPGVDPRPFFEELAELAAAGRERGLPLAELSMGMSGDFEQAIRLGATLVRVGSAVFGPRPGLLTTHE